MVGEYGWENGVRWQRAMFKWERGNGGGEVKREREGRW